MKAEFSVMQPQATTGWKRQGRVPAESLWRERGPADTLGLDFWPLEL